MPSPNTRYPPTPSLMAAIGYGRPGSTGRRTETAPRGMNAAEPSAGTPTRVTLTKAGPTTTELTAARAHRVLGNRTWASTSTFCGSRSPASPVPVAASSSGYGRVEFRSYQLLLSTPIRVPSSAW